MPEHNISTERGSKATVEKEKLQFIHSFVPGSFIGSAIIVVGQNFMPNCPTKLILAYISPTLRFGYTSMYICSYWVQPCLGHKSKFIDYFVKKETVRVPYLIYWQANYSELASLIGQFVFWNWPLLRFLELVGIPAGFLFMVNLNKGSMLDF